MGYKIKHQKYTISTKDILIPTNSSTLNIEKEETRFKGIAGRGEGEQ